MTASQPAPRIIDRRATIAVLTHALQKLRPGTTIARIASEHWAPSGHRIVLHRGLGPPPPADVAFQHVDLTRVPRPYLELARYYPRMINGAVDDISKRRVSPSILSAPGDRRGVGGASPPW